MRRTRQVLCILAAALAFPAPYPCAMPALNWGTAAATGDPALGDLWGAPLTGSKTDPTVGCFIQLIWDAGFDGLDPIDLGQNDAAGDDDVVLGWAYIGFNTGFDITDGHVWQPMTDTSGVRTNDRIYMRTWNAPADSLADYAAGNYPSTATRYGNSDEYFTVPDTPVIPDWHVGDYGSTGWNTDIIPEPSTSVLMGIGLLTLWACRKRRASGSNTNCG